MEMDLSSLASPEVKAIGILAEVVSKGFAAQESTLIEHGQLLREHGQQLQRLNDKLDEMLEVMKGERA